MQNSDFVERCLCACSLLCLLSCRLDAVFPSARSPSCPFHSWGDLDDQGVWKGCRGWRCRHWRCRLPGKATPEAVLIWRASDGTVGGCHKVARWIPGWADHGSPVCRESRWKTSGFRMFGEMGGNQEQSWEPLVNVKKLEQFHTCARGKGW
jgi:hypothetical protein